MTSIPAQQVAAELRSRLPGLGVKKLHKLLYYCQGHHLATFGSPLFPESISAWDMGPVVGSLWKSERDNGIDDRLIDLDEAVLNTVGYVVSRYGALTGSDLERLTHNEDPWLDADAKRKKGGGMRISTDAIATFFHTNKADSEDQEIQPDPAQVQDWLRGATDTGRQQSTPDTYAGIRARAWSHG